MARYDLDEGTVRRFTAAALAAHPSAGRFAALAIGPADPMADVARTVERQVFEEAFGNDTTTTSAKLRVGKQDKRSATLVYSIWRRGDRACCPKGGPSSSALPHQRGSSRPMAVSGG